MPFEIKKEKGGYFVYKKGTKEKYSKKPHKTLESAKKQMSAIGISMGKK